MNDRQDFIDRWRHEIGGPILDVLFRKAEGGELSIAVRVMLRKIDEALGRAYDEIKKSPQQNGAVQHGRK